MEADLLNAENIEKIVSEKKPDMIINLAAISSVGASWGIPQITMSVNVIGALNIMEAARKIDNRPKVMFIGSSEEYAVSDKGYGKSGWKIGYLKKLLKFPLPYKTLFELSYNLYKKNR